ncbi:hypothetical protein M5361_00700 [Ligilactobacillus agilis]|nr:hypothetical protein [Ligilactobacillus agilis]
MDIQKETTTTLTYIKENSKGQQQYGLRTILKGDGATPVVMTVGFDTPAGYDDNGRPIYREIDDELKQVQQDFMAEAIKEQKKLSEANGIDPSVVNIIGAEKEEVNND